MLGRRVKWRNSFRDFEGTVVEVKKDLCAVFEFNDLEEYSLPEKALTVCQPDCSRYASYLRKKLEPEVGDSMSELSVHDLVINALESLQGDKTFQKSKRDAIEHEIRLKSAAGRVHMSSESDEKFASKFSSKSGAADQQSKVEPGKDKSKKSPLLESKSDGDSEEEEEGSGDDGSDGSDDDDADEDEDDEDDGSSDSNTSSSSSEEADTSDSEGDDSDDDEKVDIKIYVLPNDDIRGFSVRLSDRGLETIRKALKKDYGTAPRIFFRDSDGDVVAVKSAHDLRYAYRAFKSQQNAGATLKLKLFAEVLCEPSVGNAAGSVLRGQATASSTISVDSLSPTVRFVDQVSVGGISSHASTASVSGLQSLEATAGPGMGDTTTAGVRAGADSPGRAALNFEVLWKRGELLGSGSFGKVYSGINLSTGERMAVKEVALRRSKKHKQQVQALQLEVKILSSLEHRNIIKYFGTEFTKHTLRIFLELANDGTVKDALNEFGAFPEPLVRRYTADILEGLWFLHSKKFIHRDIKPTNLLVSGGRVKLGDFGCSTTILEEDNTMEGGHNTMAGTAVYMAPEVMQAGGDFDIQAVASQQHTASEIDDLLSGTGTGKGAGTGPLQLKRTGSNSGKRRRGYGKRADVWSVGITLCEMATGKAPFASAGAAIYSVCVSKKFPTLPDLFSSEAHDFLDRCLVEDAKLRATCAELRMMPFMSEQSLEQARAQTAATLPRTAHTASHVTVHLLPSDFSFLRSPRPDTDNDEDGTGADAKGERGGQRGAGRGAGARAGAGVDSWRSGGTGGYAYGEGSGSKVEGDGEGGYSRLQRDLFQSSYGSSSGGGGDIFDRYERRKQGHGGVASTDSAESGLHTDMFRTADGGGTEHRFFSARSVSQEDDMFERGEVRGVSVPHRSDLHLKLSSNAEAKQESFPRSYTTAKECDEDADCKTGRSTMNSF